jgi:hypothetical protein
MDEYQTRRVKVLYEIEIEVDVPEDWDKDMIEFHRNESSWCSSNAVRDIIEYQKSMGTECLCKGFSCTYVGDVGLTEE